MPHRGGAQVLQLLLGVRRQAATFSSATRSAIIFSGMAICIPHFRMKKWSGAASVAPSAMQERSPQMRSCGYKSRNNAAPYMASLLLYRRPFLL